LTGLRKVLRASLSALPWCAGVRLAKIRRLPRPLKDLIRSKSLKSISGIGDSIAQRIEKLYRGEADASLERMRSKFPSGLIDLLAIPGLKPQTILKLHAMLGVNSLEQLARPSM
jgi:DNA polymerase (family 10)